MDLKLGRDWNKGRLFGAALFLLLAGGGWDACAEPVAVVGATSLGEADITYRIAVEKAYGTVIEHPAALVALIQDALEREVATRSGVVVTEQALNAFSAGVDKHSKAPEVLKAVKKAFAGDDEAYRQLYLTPKIVNRQLRSWFSRDADMQEKPRVAIQKAYALAVAGNDFAQVAKATKLKFTTQDYKTEQEDAPDALRAYFPKGMAMITPAFQTLLDELDIGKMAQTISEDESTYRVVRLLEKGNGAYKTDEIIAAKELFDVWFQAQVKKVIVRIEDKSMRTAIAAKYPKLLWNTSEEKR